MEKSNVWEELLNVLLKSVHDRLPAEGSKDISSMCTRFLYKSETIITVGTCMQVFHNLLAINRIKDEYIPSRDYGQRPTCRPGSRQ